MISKNNSLLARAAEYKNLTKVTFNNFKVTKQGETATAFLLAFSSQHHRTEAEQRKWWGKDLTLQDCSDKQTKNKAKYCFSGRFTLICQL
jgi:hypothetical protein